MNPTRKSPQASNTQPAIRTVRGVRIFPPQVGQVATLPSTWLRHDGARQVLTAGIDILPLFPAARPSARRSHDTARSQSITRGKRSALLAARVRRRRGTDQRLERRLVDLATF